MYGLGLYPVDSSNALDWQLPVGGERGNTWLFQRLHFEFSLL